MVKVKIILSLVALIVLIAVFSFISMRLWGGETEQLPAPDRQFMIQDTMTLQEFGQNNQLSDQVLREAFGLTSNEELQRTIQSFNLSHEEIAAKVTKVLAFEAEETSKNWVKIVAKFILWIAFLITVFFLLKNRKITPVVRKGLLFGAIVLFGVILGSDPSPMGTVKDAIVLFGKSRIIFPPRMIALAVMLIGGTLLANKFLCAWGCQFGALQDFIFRLGRDTKDHKGRFPQGKIPFGISNSIRIAFFILLTVVAFGWAIDIVGAIDPFKIYNPAVLGTIGVVFLAVILIAALFVYRPWCHLFCPFGLVGWLAEKISLYKINVDYETCIACNTCAEACPSTVMNAILKQEQTIPDCFACGTCLEVCPTKSIRFKSGKRQKPPAGKFKR